MLPQAPTSRPRRGFTLGERVERGLLNSPLMSRLFLVRAATLGCEVGLLVAQVAATLAMSYRVLGRSSSLRGSRSCEP